MKFQLLKFPVSMPCSLQNRDSWPHMLALGRTHNCPPERVCILGTPTHWGASRSVGDRKRSISGSKLDFKSSGHFSPCTANCLQFPWLLARLSLPSIWNRRIIPGRKLSGRKLGLSTYCKCVQWSPWLGSVPPSSKSPKQNLFEICGCNFQGLDLTAHLDPLELFTPSNAPGDDKIRKTNPAAFLEQCWLSFPRCLQVRG